MVLPKSSVPSAAQPQFGSYFDAWNSSSTGHQQAENRLLSSMGWRQSRTMKLSHQFKGGETGGKRISDQVGAGSENRNEKVKALVPKAVRERARVSVGDMLVGSVRKHAPPISEEALMARREKEDDSKQQAKLSRSKGFFDGLVIYINGSTYPQVSDHKLKHLLAENGAKISIHLGRKQVTHVILGTPTCAGGGAGGGLAASKMQKEIKRVGGCGVKFVGVEWVLESMKAGKRLPETRFSNLKIAAKKQQSVYGLLKKMDSTSSEG